VQACGLRERGAGESFEESTALGNGPGDLLGGDCIINDIMPKDAGVSRGGKEHPGEDRDGR